MAVEFDPAQRIYLEITLHLASDVDPERAFLLATQLIMAVHQSVPDLRLTYDFERSRSEKGMVVVVLVADTGDPARLELISKVIHDTGRDCVGATLSSVQLTRVA